MDLDFLKKTIHLLIFQRFYGKKLFFNLGIPLNKPQLDIYRLFANIMHKYGGNITFEVNMQVFIPSMFLATKYLAANICCWEQKLTVKTPLSAT